MKLEAVHRIIEDRRVKVDQILGNVSPGVHETVNRSSLKKIVRKV